MPSVNLVPGVFGQLHQNGLGEPREQRVAIQQRDEGRGCRGGVGGGGVAGAGGVSLVSAGEPLVDANGEMGYRDAKGGIRTDQRPPAMPQTQPAEP